AEAKHRCGNRKRIWREQTGNVGCALCERQMAQTRRVEPALSRVLPHNPKDHFRFLDKDYAQS
ncbi:hypothetical protein LXJ56_26920, partial [Escherichia coli]|nr:hypothetical protein [Escherichia coli]